MKKTFLGLIFLILVLMATNVCTRSVTNTTSAIETQRNTTGTLSIIRGGKNRNYPIFHYSTQEYVQEIEEKPSEVQTENEPTILTCNENKEFFTLGS